MLIQRIIFTIDMFQFYDQKDVSFLWFNYIQAKVPIFHESNHIISNS